MGTALRLNTIVLWRLPHIPDFPGKSCSNEGSAPAGRAVSQDTPREADEQRPAPSVWERRTRGVELRGPTLVRPPPPFMTPPPPLSRPRSNPGLQVGGGRGAGGWGGAGEALLSQIIGIPPPLGIPWSGPLPSGGRPYSLVGPAPFRGAALFTWWGRPFWGRPPIRGGGGTGGGGRTASSSSRSEA